METLFSRDPHYWGPILSTRPLSYKELVVRSLRLYFASFSKVILFSFILALLVFLPRLISYVLNYNILLTATISPHLIWLLLVNFIALLLLIAIFWRLHCVAHYKQESFNEDFNVGIHKVIYVFIAVLIENIIVFGITGLTYLVQVFLFQHHLLFPTSSVYSWQLILTFFIFTAQLALILYFSTLFIFLLPLIAIENEHIFTSIKRSISLTWNHWWQVFATQLSPWIYFVFFSLLIKFLVGVNIHLYFIGDQEPYTLAPMVLQIILFTLFIIWPASLLYVQLKDLELRKKLANKQI